MGFSLTASRHLIAGGLFRRRMKLTPDLQLKEKTIKSGFQLRPGREIVGFYLEGNF